MSRKHKFEPFETHAHADFILNTGSDCKLETTAFNAEKFLIALSSLAISIHFSIILARNSGLHSGKTMLVVTR